MLQLQETGKPVYKVKNVSLNALCELYNAPVNPMKEQVSLNIVKQFMKFNKLWTGQKHLPPWSEILGPAAADSWHDLLRRGWCAGSGAHHLQCDGLVSNIEISFDKTSPGMLNIGLRISISMFDCNRLTTLPHYLTPLVSTYITSHSIYILCQKYWA